MKRKLLAVLCAACTLTLALSGFALADGPGMGSPSSISNTADLRAAAAAGGEYSLGTNLTFTGGDLLANGPVVVSSPTVLNMNERSIFFNGSAGVLFVVEDGASLTLQSDSGPFATKSALRGVVKAEPAVSPAAYDGAVRVKKGGAFTLGIDIRECQGGVGDAVRAGHAGAIMVDGGTCVVNESAHIVGCVGGAAGAIAVRNGGTLYMNGYIDDCRASATAGNADGNGGAVSLISGGPLAQGEVRFGSGSSVENCRAKLGGALYASGGVVSFNGTVRGCTALAGGGFYLCNAASLEVLDDGLFAECSATGTMRAAESNGGAVHLRDGNLQAEGFNCSRCTSAANGGGMYLYNSVMQEAFAETPGDDSYIKNVPLNAFVRCSAAGDGGGMYAEFGSIDIRPMVDECHADGDGGGMYLSSVNTTLRRVDGRYDRGTLDNSAGGSGGTFCVRSGSLTFLGLHHIETGSAGMNGGGIDVQHGALAGAYYLESCSAGNCGGGLCIADAESVEIPAKASIERCSAKTGSALYIARAAVALRGTVTKCTGATSGTVHVNAGMLELFDGCSIADNTTEGTGSALVAMGPVDEVRVLMHGGSITGNADRAGGATVFIKWNACVTMEDGTIEGNESSTGAGTVVVDERGEYTQTGGTLGGSALAGWGSCLRVMSGGKARITGGTLTGANCTYGGAVFTAGDILASDVTISGAKAVKGAVMYVEGGTCTLERCTLRNGHAADTKLENGLGGGVYVEDGAFSARGTKIVGCRADTCGGGVLVEGGSATLDADCVIDGCEADCEGGGFYEVGGSATCAGSVVDCAAESGGGAFVCGGTFNFSGAFDGCEADRFGGGVCLSPTAGDITFAMNAPGSFEGCAATTGDDLYLDYGGTAVEGDAPESVGRIVCSFGGTPSSAVNLALNPAVLSKDGDAKLFAKRSAAWAPKMVVSDSRYELCTFADDLYFRLTGVPFSGVYEDSGDAGDDPLAGTGDSAGAAVALLAALAAMAGGALVLARKR